MIKLTEQMIDADAINMVIMNHWSQLDGLQDALREKKGCLQIYTLKDGQLLDEDGDVLTHPTNMERFNTWTAEAATLKNKISNLERFIIPALTAMMEKMESEFNDETKAVIERLNKEGREEAAQAASDRQERIFCGGGY